MVLPAPLGGSPAAREWQVNVPLTRNNDLRYGFLAPADSVTDPSLEGHCQAGSDDPGSNEGVRLDGRLVEPGPRGGDGAD